MSKYFNKILLFITILSLSSCFEIVEEITMNDDGSGNILMTLNFSRSKSKIKSILLMDSINGYKVPSRYEVETRITDLKNQLTNIKGVSNVKVKSNFEDYIFNISCNFTNTNILNEIITHFNKNKSQELNKQFSYNKNTKTFKRTYNYNLSEEVKKISKKDREVFTDASITTIYRFQSLIIYSKNKKARISKNRKAIMLRVDVNNLLANKENIKNTIKLK